jgi:hypothetical protein
MMKMTRLRMHAPITMALFRCGPVTLNRWRWLASHLPFLMIALAVFLTAGAAVGAGVLQ